MALQIDYITKSNYNSNYTRIGNVMNKILTNGIPNDKTKIFIERWKNEETRTLAKNGEDKSFIEIETFLTDEAFVDIASAYTYLKTLPEFSEAVDC